MHAPTDNGAVKTWPQRAPQLASLRCHGCSEQYDTAAHVPKVLQCGHTCCLRCIESPVSRVKCPRCDYKYSVPHQRLRELPTNLALISVQGDLQHKRHSDEPAPEPKRTAAVEAAAETKRVSSEPNPSKKDNAQRMGALLLQIFQTTNEFTSTALELQTARSLCAHANLAKCRASMHRQLDQCFDRANAKVADIAAECVEHTNAQRQVRMQAIVDYASAMVVARTDDARADIRRQALTAFIALDEPTIMLPPTADTLTADIGFQGPSIEDLLGAGAFRETRGHCTVAQALDALKK